MQLNFNDDRHSEASDDATVRSAVARLAEDEFLILSRDDEHYIQVFHNDDGTYQLEYREGAADKHFATDPESTSRTDVEGAFLAFFQQGDDWQSPWMWEKLDVGIPETFPIGHDDYHAKHIGRTADGRQFFLTTPFVPANDVDPGCEFIALYLFDDGGKLIEATIDKIGPRAALDKEEARQLYNDRLASLGEVEFGDIEVAPFRINRHDIDFGLIPRELEDDDEEDYLLIEMQPGNYMAFFHPWDGDYDT